MPPIPSQPSSSQAPPDLAPLLRRMADVTSYQLPRLRGVRTASLARALAAEARGDLEFVRAALEDAAEAVESLPITVRAEARRMVSDVEEAYRETQSAFRAALVDAKRGMANAARKHELLEPIEDAPRAEASTAVGGDDALQTKTNEVTDALRRTTQVMQAELERSVLSTQMLDESTKTLRTTASLYDNYTALLSASGTLVKALERADWWDRALILSALIFFLLVVGFVLRQRVLKPVGGFVGWWIGGSWKLIKMASGGSAPREVTSRSGEVVQKGGEMLSVGGEALREKVVGAGGEAIGKGSAVLSAAEDAAGTAGGAVVQAGKAAVTSVGSALGAAENAAEQAAASRGLSSVAEGVASAAKEAVSTGGAAVLKAAHSHETTGQAAITSGIVSVAEEVAAAAKTAATAGLEAACSGTDCPDVPGLDISGIRSVLDEAAMAVSSTTKEAATISGEAARTVASALASAGVDAGERVHLEL